MSSTNSIRFHLAIREGHSVIVDKFLDQKPFPGINVKDNQGFIFLSFILTLGRPQKIFFYFIYCVCIRYTVVYIFRILIFYILFDNNFFIWTTKSLALQQQYGITCRHYWNSKQLAISNIQK